MSDAVEGAEVVLYGVSKGYKESANCRLEANYAHQQDVDMIPLMMQDPHEYKPNGCAYLPPCGSHLSFCCSTAYLGDCEW